MALDIYVMPLWRFKAGDFRSPIEAATGFRPKIVTTHGIEERPTSIRWLDRWRSKRQVAAIRKAVQTVNQTRVRWNDEGDVIYSEQSGGMQALRAYAKWLDSKEQMPEFGLPPEGSYYKHLVWQLEIEKLSCPHLVEHDCYSGYFVPCEFDRMAEVEPYKLGGYLPATRSVGSSVRLLRELEFVQEQLRVPESDDVPPDDPLAAVKFAYLQLRTVAELSCRHRLPIIFWG